MKIILQFSIILVLCITAITATAQIADPALMTKQVDSLLRVARTISEGKDFAKALEVNAIAEKLALEQFGRMSAPYGNAAFSRGKINYIKNDFKESEKWWAEAAEILEKVLGQEDAKYASTLNNLATVYLRLGDNNKAESLFLQTLTLREKILGKKHLEYAQTLNSLGGLYLNKGSYEKAEQHYSEAKTISEQLAGKESTDYTGCLNNLANLYRKMGLYLKAEPLFIEAKDLREKMVGNKHPDYAQSVNNLAVLYFYMGKYNTAEKLYLEARDIRGKVLGKESLLYAQTVGNLAILNKKLCNYEQSEQYALESMAVQAKVLGKEHQDYAQSLSILASLYSETGDYAKSEDCYLQVKAILEKKLGKGNPDYASLLLNLAGLYKDMGIYDKSEKINLDAMEILEKVVGKDHPNYAAALSNLATLYKDKENYDKAEPLFVEALQIRERKLGKDHDAYAASLMNLGNLYRRTGRYEQAEKFYLQALDIFAKQGKEDPDYAGCLSNLSVLYSLQRNYAKAEQMGLEAKELCGKLLGKEHPTYAECMENMALLYLDMRRNDAAGPMFEEVSKIDKLLINKSLQHLSDNELNDYFERFAKREDEFVSFVQNTKAHNGPYVETILDNALFYKGILLQNANHLKSLVREDSATYKKYSVLQSYNRRLAKEYTKPIIERDSAQVAELEALSNDLEKEFIRTVAGFSEVLQEVHWSDVQQLLNPGDAAIEFIQYHYSNPEATDSVMYAALLVFPGDKKPHFIPLFEEKQLVALLEKTGGNAESTTQLYASRSGKLKEKASTYGAEMYHLIWYPLDSLLRGVRTVYFSPSGMLHQIAFAALPQNGKTLLSDRYALHQMGSTRSLVVKTAQTSYKQFVAEIFGGIQYDRTNNIGQLDSTARKSDNRQWSFFERPRNSTDDGFEYLPGTATEVRNLNADLRTRGIQVTTHTGAQATEEALKALGRDTVKSPDILHIATHGFFFPDPEKNKGQHFGEENVFKWNENPLFRSGLALAGANQTWKGEPTPANLEDGIATAYEISHLNLSNTKLVVLSACETGLGDIKGSEGVYGLQRAFKMAGADYLLVSLWQVPDKETAEFMEVFYKTWLNGKTIHEAFAKAQKQMRKKYKEVYKWGAWVLVE